jgi:hypothetical protein
MDVWVYPCDLLFSLSLRRWLRCQPSRIYPPRLHAPQSTEDTALLCSASARASTALLSRPSSSTLCTTRCWEFVGVRAFLVRDVERDDQSVSRCVNPLDRQNGINEDPFHSALPWCRRQLDCRLPPDHRSNSSNELDIHQRSNSSTW